MTDASTARQAEALPSDAPDGLDAFICYSREDAEFCRQLEKALEDFKPPRGLPGSGRHLRVFRDEDDFVGPEYFTAIEGFLARSRKLIVVSSPAARRSLYTNDEIRRFVALHGPEQLIVVLVDGVPNNEATPDEENLKAFPEALCDVAEMPLAISWVGFDPASDRIDRGRFGGSWYTLLAGLLDVDRSVVEQRDLKRARRRRRLVGSVTTGVILALTALSAWALREQGVARAAESAAADSAAVAQAQRDNAEAQRLLALASERAAADSAVVAQTQRAEAERQREEALAQRAQAWKRLMAAQAADFAARDPALTPRAMLLAVEALKIGPDGVAEGVVRSGLAKMSRLRFSTPWRPRYSGDVVPCEGVPAGVEVQRARTERVARVVRGDGRVEFLLHDGPLTHCAFLADGSIVTGSGTLEMGAGEPLAGDGTARVWDPPSPLFSLSPEGRGESGLVATAFSPTDPLVAVAFRTGGGAEVLDLETGHRVAVLEVGSGETISDLAFSADGRFLASAQIYGESFDLWRTRDFQSVGSFAGSWGEGSVQLSPSGKLLVGREGDLVGNGRGFVWDVGTGRPIAFPADGDTALWRPSLTPDGRHLVTLNDDETLVLWDVEARAQLDSVSDVQRFVQGHGSLWLFVREGAEDVAYRWSMAPGAQPVRVPDMDGGCLGFGPGSLAIRCANEGLQLFDSSSGRSIRMLDESAGMSEAAFSPDGRRVAAASYQYGGSAHTGLQAGSSLKIWDTASGSVSRRLGQQGLVAGLGFSPDGRFLGSSVYLSEESGFAQAALWVWRTEDLIEQACRVLTRNLTREEWDSYIPGEMEYRATCENLPTGPGGPGPVGAGGEVSASTPPAEAAAAIRVLDSLEVRDLGNSEADEEPWARIGRAGVCEWEESRDSMGGVRSLYCSLERAGFIDWFVAEAPSPPFRGGPHAGGTLDLDSDDFGRYDPAFVGWASERLLRGLRQPLVRPAARLAYRPWAHLGTTYYWTLMYLEGHPDLDRELQAAVAAGDTDLRDRLGEFADAAWSASLPGDWPVEVAIVAAGFWTRRGVDGSRPTFRRALVEMLTLLDPGAMDPRAMDRR